MTQQRKKKAIEYHFVDMNDPDRYKKLKVARACDFCRRRKSKCDVGIPGSGTCSNCKKSNQICIFSPVNPTSSTSVPKITNKEQQLQQLHMQQHYDNSSNNNYSTTTEYNNNNNNNRNDNYSFTNFYQEKFPFFSMDQKAHCGYEKDVIYTHITLASTTALNDEIPVYSKQIEQELFDIYFNYVHPFFPVLDKYYTLQSLKFDSESLPCSLKWAVMSIVLSRFSNHHQDSSVIANLYHQHAINQLDHTPSLLTVQTLLLLYKYQEMTAPVGTPISSTTIGYLKEAQSIHVQLQKTQQQQKGSIWTVNDEFICRSGWILFIILALGNTADERWRTMLQYCQTPSRMPTLTETEPYDRIEINTTCNLIHLIDTALLYSQAICAISDKSTLFASNNHLSTEDEFNKLSHGVHVWMRTLSEPLATALSSPPNSSFPSAQQGDKNASFTNYICLIYDILHLLISVHQPAQLHDLSKKALSVCIRAYNFTVGDIQAPQFSRLASIQGSRIVSFGLTLALQTHSYYQQLSFNHQDMDTINNFYSSCSLSFQIFDQISLSPQLYMTVQSYHNQIESKKQLKQQQESEQHHAYLSQHSNSNSSNSVPSITHGFEGTTSSSNSSNYSQTPSSTPNAKSSIDSSYYFSHHANQQSHHGEHGGWNQYALTYTTNDYPKYDWNINQQQNDYFSLQQQQQSPTMPITPTMEPEMDTFPSPSIAVDSYFQPQTNIGASVMVSSHPFNIINSRSMEILYDAKSCKTDYILR